MLGLCFFTIFIYNCSNKQPVKLSKEPIEFNVRKFGSNYSSKSQKSNIEEIKVTRTNYGNKNKLVSVTSSLINLNPNLDYFAIGEFYSNDSKLIAYEVYYFDNEFMHSFFKIDDNDNFKEVFKLRDKGVNIANIEFLLTYYLEDYSSLEFNLNINDSFDFEKTSGYTEMEMFKTTKFFNISNNKNKSNNKEVINYKVIDEIGAGVCAGCYATLVFGSCNESFTCKSKGICGATEISTDEKFNTNFPTVDILKNIKNYYELRDDFLYHSQTGKKFINYYYSLSTNLDISKLNISDFSLIISLLPDIDKAIENILDEKKDNIIIDDDLKNKVLNLINRLGNKSTDLYSHLILNDMKEEIVNLSFKKKK